MVKHIKLKKGITRKFIGLILLILTVIMAIIAVININKLNIIPDKYFYLIIGVEILLIKVDDLFHIFFILLKYKIVINAKIEINK